MDGLTQIHNLKANGSEIVKGLAEGYTSPKVPPAHAASRGAQLLGVMAVTAGGQRTKRRDAARIGSPGRANAVLDAAIRTGESRRRYSHELGGLDVNRGH